MKQLLITLAAMLFAVTTGHARPGWTLDKCLPDTEGVASDGTGEFSEIAAGERPESNASDGIIGGGITKEEIGKPWKRKEADHSSSELIGYSSIALRSVAINPFLLSRGLANEHTLARKKIGPL